MRTSGDPERSSPMTSATASSFLLAPFASPVVKPWIRNCPHRVGKSADATCCTFALLTPKLYPFGDEHSPAESLEIARPRAPHFSIPEAHPHQKMQGLAPSRRCRHVSRSSWLFSGKCG